MNQLKHMPRSPRRDFSQDNAARSDGQYELSVVSSFRVDRCRELKTSDDRDRSLVKYRLRVSFWVEVFEMLAYLLAILVGGGSVGLYVGAFFFPEVHRKHDFLWSSVGCFYALALWIYARQITGGILVGQMAGVALLGWFAWQTLKLRRQLVPIEQQTPLPSKKMPSPKVSGSAKVAKSRLEKATAANTELPVADIPVELPISPPPAPPVPIEPPPAPAAHKPIGRAMPPAPPPPPSTPVVPEDLPVEFETDPDESAWIELTLTPPTEIDPQQE